MIGKCEAKIGGMRPGLRECRAAPARCYTIYRDNEPYAQTYRCADHEPLFDDRGHYTRLEKDR